MNQAPSSSSLRTYLLVRPWGLADTFKLYLDYSVAILTRFLRLRKHLPGRYFPGSFIVGHGEVRVRRSGMLFMIRPRTSDLFIVSGEDGPKTESLFKPVRGQVVVDIGAHIGRYSVAAGLRGARLIAVEPNPENFKLLLKNLAANSIEGAVCLNLAIGDKREARMLHYLPQDGATSSLKADWTGRGRHGGEKEVEVECQTLDSILEENIIGRVDWLKIDVEGFEVEALSGGTMTLAKTDRLVLEVSRGNEIACMRLAGAAGLQLLFREEGLAVSNWYFLREHGGRDH